MDLQRGKGQTQPNWNIKIEILNWNIKIKIEFLKFRIFIKSTVILEVRMSFENENLFISKKHFNIYVDGF